jgi:hypothetical protein
MVIWFRKSRQKQKNYLQVIKEQKQAAETKQNEKRKLEANIKELSEKKN